MTTGSSTHSVRFGSAKQQEEPGNCGRRRQLLPGNSNRQFAVSEVIIQNARAHHHETSWELYIIKTGHGTLVLDTQRVAVREGDIIEIPPGVVHQAIAEPEMTVYVVMSPHGSEEEDIVYDD